MYMVLGLPGGKGRGTYSRVYRARAKGVATASGAGYQSACDVTLIV